MNFDGKFCYTGLGCQGASDTDAFVSVSLSAASTEDSMILLLMRYVMFALKLL